MLRAAPPIFWASGTAFKASSMIDHMTNGTIHQTSRKYDSVYKEKLGGTLVKAILVASRRPGTVVALIKPAEAADALADVVAYVIASASATDTDADIENYLKGYLERLSDKVCDSVALVRAGLHTK
jgi:uncharacterized protein (DUF2126 family)